MTAVLIASIFTNLALVACLAKMADDIHAMRGEYLKLIEAENDNNKDIIDINRELLKKIERLSDIQNKIVKVWTMEMKEKGDTVSETTETTNS